MTRRERLEAKLEKRREWAASREAKSDAAFRRSSDLVAGIPLGQPILIGHHSEKRHRRTVERSQAAGFAGVEHSKMADHHKSRAAGLAIQLEGSIFSDDADAVEQLEAKVADLEAKRDRMKARNAAYRKGLEAFAAFEGCTLEQATKRRELIESGYSWCRKPHPGYELTNLGATIRNAKKRIEDVKRRQARTAEAEKAGGVVILRLGDDWCLVTFAEKPERSILEALRAAGFSWGGGSWSGQRSKLPEVVSELAAA